MQNSRVRWSTKMIWFVNPLKRSFIQRSWDVKSSVKRFQSFLCIKFTLTYLLTVTNIYFPHCPLTRSIAYPFNAKQPNDMIKRHHKVTFFFVCSIGICLTLNLNNSNESIFHKVTKEGLEKLRNKVDVSTMYFVHSWEGSRFSTSDHIGLYRIVSYWRNNFFLSRTSCQEKLRSQHYHSYCTLSLKSFLGGETQIYYIGSYQIDNFSLSRVSCEEKPKSQVTKLSTTPSSAMQKSSSGFSNIILSDVMIIQPLLNAKVFC